MFVTACGIFSWRLKYFRSLKIRSLVDQTNHWYFVFDFIAILVKIWKCKLHSGQNIVDFSWNHRLSDSGFFLPSQKSYFFCPLCFLALRVDGLLEKRNSQNGDCYSNMTWRVRRNLRENERFLTFFLNFSRFQVESISILVNFMVKKAAKIDFT